MCSPSKEEEVTKSLTIRLCNEPITALFLSISLGLHYWKLFLRELVYHNVCDGLIKDGTRLPVNCVMQELHSEHFSRKKFSHKGTYLRKINIIMTLIPDPPLVSRIIIVTF
jgi:hypothetical protein